MLWTLITASALPGAASAEFPVIAPDETPDARIINGTAAAKNDWPMAGGLLLAANVDFFGFELEQTALMCSSTLIAPDVVLLAAHCIDIDSLVGQFDPNGGVQMRDATFYWSRQADLSGYQIGGPAGELPADAIAARDVVFHPDWDFAGLQTGLARNNDVALMFLEEPILDVEPAVVPNPDEFEIAEGDEVIVVGWGQQSQVNQGEQPPPGSVGLKQMGTSVVSEVGRFEFKVGELESDVRKCHGDSGGPSFKRVDSSSSELYRIVGVTSHAYDASDCRVTGGVDTRVSAFHGWIDQEMRQRCRAGTRSWCDDWGLLAAPDASGAVEWEDRELPKSGCSTAPVRFPLFRR